VSTNPNPDHRVNADEPQADVVHLDAHRDRRISTGRLAISPDNQADSGPDTGADMNPDTTGPALVDSIDAQRRPRLNLAALRDAERRPVIPGWLRSRTELVGNLAWAAELAGHTVVYHLVRVPKYAGRLAWRSPRGLARVVSGYLRWLADAEGEPVRQAVVRAAVTDPDEARTYQNLSRQRDRRVRWRGLVSVPVVLATATGIALITVVPLSVSCPLVTVVVVVLGLLGAPADRPLLDTAVVRAEVAPLTSAEVVQALAALNIGGINRALRAGDTGKRWFPSPITRENNTGWRADVELPRGVPASDVVDKREELAAALTRPLGCVWPEVNAEIHPGRLILFVADRDMSRAKQKPWPLLKTGTVDLFRPFAFGTDPRGRPVPVTLMFASMIIGSIPRMGKTFALRLVLLAATLDPRAWVLPFDLKGTGDLSALESVAYRYRAGDDEEDIEYAIAAMRQMRVELRRRTKVIRELPRDLCPENKVTPELAARKSLGLQPIVIGVDECQVWFEHSKYGSEFEEICTDLVKRGPAAGITLILATQRPDAKSIPTGISANAVLRFCLKVMGWRENDMVLGDGMHGNGVKATMFSRRDRGIGYLAGEGDDPTIARTFYLDNPTAEQVVARARQLREKAGTITGHAAGQTVDTTTVRRDTLLDDLVTVMSVDEPKLWTTILVDRLVGLRPDAYDGFNADQLREALKPWGVRTGQVWGTDPDTGERGNRKGITRADLLKTVTKRDGNQGGRAAG
jgi:S-DNA-T family DNA segregation ATPase FtsK/SpoIIIE